MHSLKNIYVPAQKYVGTGSKICMQCRASLHAAQSKFTCSVERVSMQRRASLHAAQSNRISICRSAGLQAATTTRRVEREAITGGETTGQ